MTGLFSTWWDAMIQAQSPEPPYTGLRPGWMNPDEEFCPVCAGDGWISIGDTPHNAGRNTDTCPKCKGEGVVKRTET